MHTRINYLILLLIPACALFSCNKSTKSGSEDTQKKVLLIGIDGTRVDILKKVSSPNIDTLIANGFLADSAQTRMPTVSGPGWSSMLTGVWSDKHGVMGNQFKNKNYDQYPDFLTRLEQIDSTWQTYSATTWPPLADTLSGGPLLSDAVDIRQTFSGDEFGYPTADSLAVDAAAQHLKNRDPDAAFVYIGNPDGVAHRVGPLTEEYRQSLRKADMQVGKLIEALKSRPTYEKEDWLILISTDHGHVDEGGHGGPSPIEKNIFVVASGPSVTASAPRDSVLIVDVAATALNYLRGGKIDTTWKLDGQAIQLNKK